MSLLVSVQGRKQTVLAHGIGKLEGQERQRRNVNELNVGEERGIWRQGDEGWKGTGLNGRKGRRTE